MRRINWRYWWNCSVWLFKFLCGWRCRHYYSHHGGGFAMRCEDVAGHAGLHHARCYRLTNYIQLIFRCFAEVKIEVKLDVADGTIVWLSISFQVFKQIIKMCIEEGLQDQVTQAAYAKLRKTAWEAGLEQKWEGPLNLRIVFEDEERIEMKFRAIYRKEEA